MNICNIILKTLSYGEVKMFLSQIANGSWSCCMSQSSLTLPCHFLQNPPEDLLPSHEQRLHLRFMKITKSPMCKAWRMWTAWREFLQRASLAMWRPALWLSLIHI